jgi:hypothetical protein
LVCLATDDSTQDAKLEKLNLIVSRAIIDLALKKYVGAPLANPPDAVVEIANLLTAGMHLTKNAPEEKEHPTPFRLKICWKNMSQLCRGII